MDKFTVTFEKRAYTDSDKNTLYDFFPVFEYEFQVTLPQKLWNKDLEKQKKYCNKQYWDFYNSHEGFKDDILAKVKQEADDFRKDNPLLNYEYDEKVFNNAKNNNQVTPGRVWHHHETPGLMQLVREPIHRRIHHIGGASIWCNKSEYESAEGNSIYFLVGADTNLEYKISSGKKYKHDVNGNLILGEFEKCQIDAQRIFLIIYLMNILSGI